MYRLRLSCFVVFPRWQTFVTLFYKSFVMRAQLYPNFFSLHVFWCCSNNEQCLPPITFPQTMPLIIIIRVFLLLLLSKKFIQFCCYTSTTNVQCVLLFFFVFVFLKLVLYSLTARNNNSTELKRKLGRAKSELECMRTEYTKMMAS